VSKGQPSHPLSQESSKKDDNKMDSKPSTTDNKSMYT
jgi:hypothetical protein